MAAATTTPATSESLSTNAAKRDKQLTARLAAVGARYIKTTASKYSGDLTDYTVFFTFDGDPGPRHTYEHGTELATPWHGYSLGFKGTARLDRDTAEAAYLARAIWTERQNFHYYGEGKIEPLYKALDSAEHTYGRTAAAALVAETRGKGDRFATLEELIARRDAARAVLVAAVTAYDAAQAAMIAIIGECPPYVR